jgi:hypothetical protein
MKNTWKVASGIGSGVATASGAVSKAMGYGGQTQGKFGPSLYG